MRGSNLVTRNSRQTNSDRKSGQILVQNSGQRTIIKFTSQAAKLLKCCNASALSVPIPTSYRGWRHWA
jgi:hypothetical protein